VHAFVTARDDVLNAKEVRAYCGQRLADYKVPDLVTIGTGPLPRNAAGKVQKAVLRARIAKEMA
jgi:acyl-CoA synthetase (AMP-forming)/AMP-acid ligase II